MNMIFVKVELIIISAVHVNGMGLTGAFVIQQRLGVKNVLTVHANPGFVMMKVVVVDLVVLVVTGQMQSADLQNVRG